MIKRTELLKVLEIIKPGLSSNDIIVQSDCIAFNNDKIITYNDEISITHPFETGIVGAVKAKKLYPLLNKIKQDKIEIKTTDTEAQFKAGKTTVGLGFYNEFKLPIEEIELSEDWKPIPADFVKAISFCMFSAAKDMQRPILTCIHVNGTTVESCDNIRLTRYIMSDNATKTPILIPAKTAAQIIRYPITELAVSISNSWIQFRTTEGTIISCRIYSDEYKDLNLIIEQANDGVSCKLPDETLEALTRAEVFAKSEYGTINSIDINLSENKLIIRAEDESDWIEEQIDIDYVDHPIRFSINPFIFKDILQKTTEFSLSENLIKFEKDNWIHVAALMRDSNYEPQEEPVFPVENKIEADIPY